MRRFRGIPVLIIIAFVVPLALAQADSAGQNAIDEAERAVTAAENVGAPIYAKDLYDEALVRLNIAKQTIGDSKRSIRESARLRAVEARHAARAAEARARWSVNTTEARNLRVDITRLGGQPVDVVFTEDFLDTNRGATSLDRVNFAQAWIDRAKAAGGNLVAPEDLKTAEAWIGSARRIARADKQNESADHLAYTAEMLARRAYYLALRSDIDRVLPSLQLERTRLVQEESERLAASERRRREQELDSLRSQLEARERAIQAYVEADRAARLEAEQRLYDSVARYEAALATQNQTDVDALRRQVEDQRLQLQSMQERQRLSEQTLTVETERLRDELARARASGQETAEVLSQREAELMRRQDELDRLRREREESVQRASETAQRMTELEQRTRQAEAESERLRAEVEQAQQRAEEAQQELDRVRAERDRLERIRVLETSGAIVRAESRGLVVTLPGIFFDSGKSTLKPGARNILIKASEELKRMETVRISIEGHTDSVGGEEMNLELSQKRAEAVRDLLISQGVEASRISATGRGEAVPVATNNTSAGRQQNRRVEIIINQ